MVNALDSMFDCSVHSFNFPIGLWPMWSYSSVFNYMTFKVGSELSRDELWTIVAANAFRIAKHSDNYMQAANNI